MFRRRAQRLFRGMGRPIVPPMLQRANQMMATGDYENAAAAYKELAQGAEDRFPQRAPFLFMEAAGPISYADRQRSALRSSGAD